MKTKEVLEATIVRLEEAIEANNTDTRCFEADLKIAKNRLENINKPELTQKQFDKIEEAIQDGVGNFAFDDTENFDKEFGIDYDGRVTLEHFDLNCSQALVEKIAEEVFKLFAETECPEEEISE